MAASAVGYVFYGNQCRFRTRLTNVAQINLMLKCPNLSDEYTSVAVLGV